MCAIVRGPEANVAVERPTSAAGWPPESVQKGVPSFTVASAKASFIFL
jgi:hypothetical protein